MIKGLQMGGRQAASDKRASGSGAGGAANFMPGHRPLFSYKRYADQEPLDLNLAEAAAVVALVLGPEAVGGLLGREYSTLLNVDSSAAAAGLLPGGKSLEVRLGPTLLPPGVLPVHWTESDHFVMCWCRTEGPLRSKWNSTCRQT
jgi:hypothetical protein